ncbi:MAG: ABC transporter permease subunit [Candidatus Thermoplasmatota archaeon]|jgi:ABC-2 type transport system permease protein|nr:ABC transporter permease subunit [Candidatus Thermoplasmatota archaeon]
MNFSLVREMMRKDLQEVRKNGYVFYSLLLLPIMLVVISVIDSFAIALSSSGKASMLLPTFSTILVFIPAIITSLIGSTSVILEKNNHSLEPLLATPITDSELFAGKALAPLSIGILLSWLAFTLYMAIMDVLTYGHLGYFLFPTELTLVQMFFLAPVTGMLGTFLTLLVSSKMKDVRAAQQVSALVVLPLLLLIFLPIIASGSDLLINLLAGVGFLIAALAIFFVSVKAFRRETILISWGK